MVLPDKRFLAFQGCTSLTSITIPDSVTEIGTWAFKGCSKLATINVTRTEEQWNSWDSIRKGYEWNNGCPSDMIINYNYKG